jgi:hypothetical protein
MARIPFRVGLRQQGAAVRRHDGGHRLRAEQHQPGVQPGEKGGVEGRRTQGPVRRVRTPRLAAMHELAEIAPVADIARHRVKGNRHGGVGAVLEGEPGRLRGHVIVAGVGGGVSCLS